MKKNIKLLAGDKAGETVEIDTSVSSSSSNALLAVDKYKYCNHHHELTDEHEMVNFGNGEFVANKAAIPLLKALNEIGFRTRTHHYDGSGRGFVSILLDEGVTIETKTVNEIDADRSEYDGQKELLILWNFADR